MSHRKFIKSILWTALFAAGAAFAQEAAVSGADFTGGKADAQLGAIGKQAAASGKTVVITAPAYWQAKAAARVRAGAHGKPLTIRFSNGFYENVLVRVEAPAPKPETEAKPETASKTVAKTKPQTTPEPKMVKAEIAPRPVSKPVAAAPNHSSAAPAPRAAVPSASPQPAKRLAVPPSPPAPPPSRIVAVPQVSHQPQVVPIPTSAANPTGVKSELPGAPAATGDAARQRLLSALNDGRPAAGELREAQLQSGDQLYSDGGTLAVVRLEGLRRSFYWLTGPVDLQRAQYSPQGSGRYLVTGSVNPKAPPTHRSETRRVVDARVPAAHDTTRAALERQYNNGQPVTTSLHVRELQPEDRLLIDGKTILVVRREGNLMTRYWLEGSIDLDQSGVRKTDQNLYEVTGSVH